MKDYNDIFVWNENEFGRTSLERHKIDTGDAAPIKQHFYRTSHKNEVFIKEEIDCLLQKGLIKPSNSPWSSLVVVVERKNGKLRLCIDYRKLNNVTKKDSYPLPRIDDILETLSGSQWFSSLDLANGFWQVELDPTTKEKTAFTTKFGIYEFETMPFGLCNGPATFQRLMEKALNNYFGNQWLYIWMISILDQKHLKNIWTI